MAKLKWLVSLTLMTILLVTVTTWYRHSIPIQQMRRVSSLVNRVESVPPVSVASTVSSGVNLAQSVSSHVKAAGINSYQADQTKSVPAHNSKDTPVSLPISRPGSASSLDQTKLVSRVNTANIQTKQLRPYPRLQPPVYRPTPEELEPTHFQEIDKSIFISVKTAIKFHEHRLSLALSTWMQTVIPQQLHIATDKGSDDEWLEKAKASDIHVTEVNCPFGHGREALCCKSGQEFDQFYKALEKGENFRWYCHFDDDEYVNILSLSRKLETLDSSSDYYFAHWLSQIYKKDLKAKYILRKYPNAVRKTYRYGHGAAYCISLGLMKKVEKYLRGKSFPATCETTALPDDVAIGKIIGAVLGVNLTEASGMLSHYDKENNFTIGELKEKITVSRTQGVNCRNKANIFLYYSEDPIGFLSYHCLLYPRIKWCQDKKLLHLFLPKYLSPTPPSLPPSPSLSSSSTLIEDSHKP